ncbi:epoxyqueuosine reductase [Paraperlucidibaca baekdonensis]|uniref:Epoxyqueuosine reductase n=2 Tax=Paraperlucidibaca baekdonensis TaxID=748120 RepID=A0A3E0H885_9GAMM|nr:epoxyqueuosine reductase [Paraperlucidibaca baekdonensis]
MCAMTRIPLRPAANLSPPDLHALKADIADWARALGFQQMGVSGIDLGEHPAHLKRWLAQGFEAGMGWMHEPKRASPAELVPNTQRIISLRMDYLPADPRILETLADGERAYIARYALGRDYHKLIRKRVQKLADRMSEAIGPFGYRAFVDSAPVLEKAIASQAGLGWMGKHTLILNRHAGSYFFLAELFTDVALPVDAPVSSHCGSCSACMNICPTQAIIAPYVLDANKCISYLTIEHRGVIAEPLRRAIGNRIFGCDDCQLVCPWNRYARASAEPDFVPRHGLDGPALLELWHWDEATWQSRTEGMPLRRTRYEGWLRNVSIALANAPANATIVQALEQRRESLSSSEHLNAVVAEHIDWAISEQAQKLSLR